jgi:diketogulonate reductase-like aldo/keto reductase
MPIPRIIYGTAWKKERTEALVKSAIEQGFRAIDTACQPKHYDEAGVGAGIAACLGSSLTRSDLYLQTKFTQVPGHDPKRIPYDPQAPLEEQIAQSFQVSLSNLRTDYLDCLVLHSPMDDLQQTLRAWSAMEAIHRNGGVRQLGISNCYDPGLFEALHRSTTIKPAVIQNRFYAQSGYDLEIRRFCKRNGIVYQSFWTLTANPHLLSHALLRSLAEKHQRSAAQILFRYLSQQGVVPLTGTRSQQHMHEDLAIFEFDLDGAECENVSSLIGV